MYRKLILALTFAATFAVAGFVSPGTSDARVLRRRPVVGTYYYYNGPPRAFVGPPIRAYSNAYDIGPYGPGYGWPYRRPVGVRFYVGF